MLCSGSGTGAVASITADGRLLVDRGTLTINVLANGEQKVAAYGIVTGIEDSS